MLTFDAKFLDCSDLRFVSGITFASRSHESRVDVGLCFEEITSKKADQIMESMCRGVILRQACHKAICVWPAAQT